MSGNSSWMRWYHELEKYYFEYGNIDVPAKYETEEGLKLGLWLNNQRRLCVNSSKKVVQNRIQLLNELGMKWDYHAETWDTYYYELEKYYEEHGNISISRDYQTNNGKKLGIWLNHQRESYNSNGRITHDQIVLLNDIEIDWSTRTTLLLNKEINDLNKDKYYSALDDRLNHILDDLNHEVNTQIIGENQKELCKTIVKRMWR